MNAFADLGFWSEFASRLSAGLHLGEYYVADWLYLATLLAVVLCLYRGQRSGTINLWDMVRTTKKDAQGGEHIYTDPRKFFEVGAFVVATCAFSYKVIQGKLEIEFMLVYLGTFTGARFLRDREQRLNKMIEQGINPKGIFEGMLGKKETPPQSEQEVKQ